MPKVFIDGSAGTTGLRIHERLRAVGDITLIEIAEAYRKDPAARADCMREADAVFLCLPDAAAVEAVTLADGPDTVVIDTSTAHRTAEGWTYGFPELFGMREKIRQAKRIANPGCHASGFVSLIEPLVRNGLLSRDVKLSCFSLTGYSGGGKSMIADYTDAAKADSLQAPRMYGLNQMHKHLPEMVKVCGLTYAPVFCPIVSSYYAGMEVVAELPGSALHGGVGAVRECYADYYHDGCVRFKGSCDENGFISAGGLAGTDGMEISVYGNSERVLLVSRFDNLGKGASGAAIQNMNLALGRPELAGLIV